MGFRYKSKHSQKTSQTARFASTGAAPGSTGGRSVRGARRAGGPEEAIPFFKTKRNRLIALIVGLLIILVPIAYALMTYLNVADQLAPPSAEREAINGALDEPAKPEEASYILLLGNDRRPGSGWARSDTIIVVRLDPASHSVSMLSLSRDSRVNVPGRGMTKLNHASAWGGPALMIDTVKELTGLPIHHYVQVDFEGFAAIVDALGGVEMNVDRATTSPEGVSVAAGKQTLSGKQALAVVRNRKGYADGDFARMRNQQAFLLALAKQASQARNLTRLPQILDSTSKNIQTDMGVAKMAALAGTYRDIEKKDMRTASAPGRAGRVGKVSYVLLDEAKFRDVVADLADGGFEEKPADK